MNDDDVSRFFFSPSHRFTAVLQLFRLLPVEGHTTTTTTTTKKMWKKMWTVQPENPEASEKSRKRNKNQKRKKKGPRRNQIQHRKNTNRDEKIQQPSSDFTMFDFPFLPVA
jgi:hypothetical protein